VLDAALALVQQIAEEHGGECLGRGGIAVLGLGR